MKGKRISKIAVRTSSGHVVTAPIGQRHADIPATGQRGFMTNNGEFVGRLAGSRIAQSSGQTRSKKPLHSHMLKKGK